MVEVRKDDDRIAIPELKWDEQGLGQFKRSYDKQRDILFVHLEPKRPAVSLDVGGYLWIRFDPETEEVVGVEIEDFEQVFLVKFPELRLMWKDLKPRIVKPPFRKRNTIDEYLQLLFRFIKNLLNTHPPQLTLDPR